MNRPAWPAFEFTVQIHWEVNTLADLSTYLFLAQIILGIALTALVILQSRGLGISGLFGGGDSGGVYKRRRGVERTLFNLTIGLAVVFFLLATITSLVI